MTSLNDEEIAKSFLKAYQYLNSFYKDNLGSLITTNINEPYGILRSFIVRAYCIKEIGFKSEIKQINNYKYPVFLFEDGTFTIHYDNKRNKIPSYCKDLSKANIDSGCNLFANNHQQTNDKQHFMLIYSGKDRLESLTINKLILQDNKATMQFIKNIKISNDCLLEKENQIKNPPYKIKEEEQKDIEDIIKKLKRS